jgi:hypothetical protein
VSIRAARPALQKMIEDEAEDTAAVAKLLELSQTINADLEKYDLLRKGDFQGAQEVVVKPMYVLCCGTDTDQVLLEVRRMEGLQVSLISMASWVDQVLLHHQKQRQIMAPVIYWTI